MSGGGKFEDGGPVIRTQERANPLDAFADRMRGMGAPDDVVADTVQAIRDGRSDLHMVGDGELASYIGARLAGTDAGFRAADLAVIEQARRDPDLWADARDKVQGTVAGVIAWVGTNAGRAVLAHEAEVQAAEDGDRQPRRTLMAFLRGVHGGLTVGD